MTLPTTLPATPTTVLKTTVSKIIGKTKPKVLIFSATDPTCGAGMQADVLTVAQLGCQPLSVVTAVTVQNTLGVQRVIPLPADVLMEQARVVLADCLVPPAVCKIGVLASSDNVLALAEFLADYPQMQVVLDPVLASGRGDAFADARVVDALIDKILPRIFLLTPNIGEAQRLSKHIEKRHIEQKLDGNGDDIADANIGDASASNHSITEAHYQCWATSLLASGCQQVLITGGHDETTPSITHRLYGAQSEEREERFYADRLPYQYHGSGCRLASSIAAGLAKGLGLSAAITAAQTHISHSLLHAEVLGRGQLIPQ